MRRQIDFCIEAGSDALAFGWGTESHLLTDAERQQAWTVAARYTDGRVPLIAATTHPAAAGVLALTNIAKDCGADAAMVNPDSLRGDRLIGLYRDLSEQVGLPLVVQDAQGNASTDDLVAAVKAAPSITSLKIECPATPHKMGIVRQALDEALSDDREVTILGGSNGALLIEELDRGSVGTMPHPALIDAFKRVCEQHLDGDRAGAWDGYTRVILPVARLVQAAGVKGGSLWLHKHLFKLAGIFATDHCRIETGTPPEWAMFFEVRSATGFGLGMRTADAIGMTTYPSQGLNIHGFEFKSSRSDLLSELRDVSKSASIQKYCDHWWLVLGRKDLIKVGELPSTWGLIVPYGGGLQIEVKSPALKPCDLDRSFVASLLRSAKKEELDNSERRRIEHEGFMEGRKVGLADAGFKLKHLKQDVEAFEKASGVSVQDTWNSERIGMAVKYIVASGVESMNSKLRYYLKSVRSAADDVDKILTELGEHDEAKILRDPDDE